MSEPKRKLTMLKPRIGTVKTERVPILGDGGWRTSTMTTGERGYGYRWQKARLHHLKQHPLCIRCKAEGRVTEATVVDHRVPHRGDQALFWDPDNWDSLCASHHSADKQREERGSDPAKRIGLDGFPE